jgi:hypothetical protein
MSASVWRFGRLFLIAFVVYTLFRACTAEDSYAQSDPVQVPTQGLITTVAEVKAGDFKIESEVPVDSVADSRIITKYLDGSRDTFTLDQAKVMQTSSDTTRSHRSVRAGGLGFWFFMMSGRMGGYTPRSSAYVNNQAYQRTQNSAGSRLRSTSRTTTKPSSRSRSGFGAGKSSRSFGG